MGNYRTVQPQIHAIAAMVHEDLIQIFHHAIYSFSRIITHLIKALLHHGSSQLFKQLIIRNSEESIWKMPAFGPFLISRLIRG